MLKNNYPIILHFRSIVKRYLSETSPVTLLASIFIILLPFIHLNHGWNPYELPKFIFFIVGSYSLGIISFILLLKKSINLSPLTKAILLFGIVVFISNLLGLDPKTSVLGTNWRYQGFITLLSGILLYLAISLGKKSAKDYSFYTTSIIVTNSALVLFTLWQITGFYVLHNYAIPLYQGRFVGTMGNPNFLGGILVMTLPFVLFSKNHLLHSKLLKFLIILLNLIAIYYTQSRGAILACGVVFIIYFFHSFRLKKSIKIMMGIFTLLTLVFVSFSIINRGSIWDNRGIIWKEGVKAVVKKPLLGYGQENFELIFPKERLVKVDSAHNVFLETLVSSGTVGLLFYLAVLFQGLKKVSFTAKVALIAFLIRAQFNPLSIAEIGYFWVLLAL